MGASGTPVHEAQRPSPIRGRIQRARRQADETVLLRSRNRAPEGGRARQLRVRRPRGLPGTAGVRALGDASVLEQGDDRSVGCDHRTGVGALWGGQ